MENDPRKWKHLFDVRQFDDVSQEAFFCLGDFGSKGNEAANELMSHIQARPMIGPDALHKRDNFLHRGVANARSKLTDDMIGEVERARYPPDTFRLFWQGR